MAYKNILIKWINYKNIQFIYRILFFSIWFAQKITSFWLIHMKREFTIFKTNQILYIEYYLGSLLMLLTQLGASVL